MKKKFICGRNFFVVIIFLSILKINLSAQDTSSVLSKAPVQIEPVNAPFEMPQMRRPLFPDKNFNIKDFGAIEGGIEKNSEAIKKTIETAVKAGGGNIIISKGKWLTGAIYLDNNINLHLEKDAELIFSQDPKDYLPVVFSRHEDTECYKFSSFVYANGKNNIAITGEGTLNGQGKPWWDYREQQRNAYKMLREMVQNNVPVEQRIFDGTKNDMLRPAFFQPMNCKNVFVEGVTFLYGAFWTITPTYCENVIVRKVKIVTEGEYGHTPNGDGVDPSSCKNVLIEYCDMSTGDDCIAIKSGRDEDGQRVGIPTENLVARHNFFRSGHGGIVIGSETSGGIKNIYGYDCYCNGTDRALRIKTGRGRGAVVENLWFKNITASKIVNEAIHLNMLYTTKRLPVETFSKRTPVFRNFHFENITCEYAGKNGIELLGLPESMIDNITFKNIKIKSAGGINIQDSQNLKFENVSVIPDNGALVTALDSKNILINKLGVPDNVKVGFKIDGKVSDNIKVDETDLSKVANKIELGPDVKGNAIQILEKQ